VAEYARTMARRRPLTPQQLAEIQEAARRGPDGKPLRGTMRGMIEGTATAPRPVAPPRQPLPPKGKWQRSEPASWRRAECGRAFSGAMVPASIWRMVEAMRRLTFSAQRRRRAMKLLQPSSAEPRTRRRATAP